MPSSRNAVTHGIHTSVLVLKNESEPEYRRIEAEHLALWNPVGPFERLLVDQIVAAEWRLRRTWSSETAALDLQMDRDAPDLDEEMPAVDQSTRAAVAFTRLSDRSTALANFGRNEVRFNRIIDRASLRLAALQDRRTRREPQLQTGQPNTDFLQNEIAAPEPQSMTPEEVAKNFGTLVGTFGTTWSSRTNVRRTPTATKRTHADQRTPTAREGMDPKHGMDPHQTTPPQPDETHEQWTYTRAVILRTLNRFPDALDAIQQALRDFRRRCPKELFDPA